MALDYTQLLFASQVVSNGSNDDLFTLTGTNESVDNLVVRFTNYTAGAVTVSAWCQAAAGTEADADRFLASYSIPANDYRDVDAPRMVGGGSKAKLTVTAGTATAIVVSQISGLKRS